MQVQRWHCLLQQKISSSSYMTREVKKKIFLKEPKYLDLSNLFEFLINFKVQIKIFWLIFVLNFMLPSSRISNSFSSFSLGGYWFMLSKLLTRFALSYIIEMEAKKKCIFVSGSILQGRSGFVVNSKLNLNLCSHKWMKPQHNLVSSLITTSLWILKILLSDVLVEFIRVFRKLRLEAEMRIFGKSLFKTFLTHGEKEILKILSSAKKSSEWILVSAGVSKRKN